MNAHRRAEAKRARRAKRIAASRGGGRGPITRAGDRAALTLIGENRVLAMVASTRSATPRKPRRKTPHLRLVPTSYGTFTRPELVESLEDRHYADDAA